MTVPNDRARDSGAAADEGTRVSSGSHAEIAGIAYSTTDLLGDFDALASAINRLIPHDFVALATREDSGRRFAWSASVGSSLAENANQSPVPASTVQELFGESDGLLLDGTELARSTTSAHLFCGMKKTEIGSAIAIPIRWSGEITGFLSICSGTAGAYSDGDLDVAREVAALLSGAVAVEGLRHELDREITELNAIAEMGRLLVSGTDQDEQLERCAGIIKLLVNYDRFSISIYDPEQDAIVTIYASGVDVLEPSRDISIPKEELREFLSDGRAFMPSPEEMKDLAERVPDVRAVLDRLSAKSLISVPLHWQDQLVGAMQVFSSEEGRYGERDRLTMERIANQVSGALAVTRLTQTLLADVKQRMVLADLSRILSSAQDPRDVVGPFADKLQEILPFDSLAVNIVDYTAGVLVDWFNQGLELPRTFPGNMQRLEGTLTEHVASSRSVFRYCASHEKDALENVPNSMTSVRAGIRSWLVAPMISNNRVVGTIRLQSREPNIYGPGAEPVIERVASQVAGAFANAIAHERETALAEEREKNLKLDVEKQELQRLNEMRDRFLGMVSHELKTPLTSVYAFANILARNNSHNLSPRQLNHIRVIQRNSRRLDMMIGDLLDVSRIEQGTFSLVNRPFNTRMMLAEVIESLEPILGEKGQVVEIASDLGDDMVDGDRNRLGQVVANLVSNSSKYSRDKETITLRAWVSGTRFSVSVEDHGVGIAWEDLDRVFEPFYRIDNDITRRAPGTGIGLFVAKTIIEQHGGEIEVQSQPGFGTIVRFWIPMEPPAADPPASTS